MKNKSYIGISFIILIVGIWAIPKIMAKFQKSNLFEVGPIPKFDFIDQNNNQISNITYLGKVYVVEFFFSTCPTICPIMNKNMIELQDYFYGNPKFGMASFTINPEYDTPEILKEHTKNLGVKNKNWHFLTGNKEQIYNLANKGFNLYVGKNNQAAGKFEHSGLFALIDKKGIIRCRNDKNNNPIVYYDGLEKEGIKMLKQDIKILLEE